jgi:cell division protein FtsB
VLRLVALLLMALLLVLGVKLWTGDWSMREVWRLRERVAEQKRENQKLRQRNEALSAEVQDLKNGNEAVEERARSELGLVKPDETFYQVVEPPADAKKSGDEHH